MKAVANLILANAPFAPGPRLLPLTMLAPVRRPLAAPIAEPAAAAQQGDEVITGPHATARQQSRPTWLSAFLRATEETPAAQSATVTPLPDSPLCAPR